MPKRRSVCLDSSSVCLRASSSACCVNISCSVCGWIVASRRRVGTTTTSLARSNSSDFWILGAGPFQSGTIHDGTQFAGQQIDLPFIGKNQAELAFEQEKLIRQYEDHATFLKPTDDSKDESPADVVPAENEDVPAADEGSTEEPGNLPPAVEKTTPIQQ